MHPPADSPQPPNHDPDERHGQVVSEATGPRVGMRTSVAPDQPAGIPNAAGNCYLVWVICIFLLLAVGLVFGQTVHFDFINLDDAYGIYMNRHITDGLTMDGVKWAVTHFNGGTYTPATWITHMLDCHFYGLNAGGHHLTNVLLHAATVVLLFLVLRQMTGRLWPSAFVAAIFAIHPLRAESVAWVIERKDVLSGLFFVLALGAYVRYVRHPFSYVRYLTIVVLFLLGLMAKQMLVTLPFVLLLLDYWPFGRLAAGTVARPVLEKLPLLALAVVFGIVAVCSTIGHDHASDLLDQRFDLLWRVENVPISYISYLGMFFYPVDLAILYPRSGPDLPVWKVLGAVLILVVLTSATLVCRRRCPYLPVGWLWYLVMLVPVSGLLQFDMHATATIADRFTYLPQIGLCIALTWGLADALSFVRFRRTVCAVGATLILAILMLCAWRQVFFWRDNDTLWTHTLACTSRNRWAHYALGNACLDRGQVDKAMEQYRAAIAIEPDYAMAHYNLGAALEYLGRLDEAREHYEKAVQFQPDNAAAHNNLGHILLMRGRLDQGLAHCREALNINPEFAEARFNVGNVLYYRGRIDEAIEEYRKALDVKPKYAEAHHHLGLALAKNGQLDDAIAEYGKALESGPADAAQVHNHLGLALVARGRPEEAATHYREALAIQPGFTEARRNLNRALADEDRRTDK